MDNICSRCGAPSGGGKFCANCGSPLDPSAAAPAPALKKPVNKKGVIGAAIAAILVLFIVAAVVIGVAVFALRGGYKGVLDGYFTALEQRDPELLQSVAADYWVTYKLADSKQAYLTDDLEDIIDEAIDDFDCGEDVQIDYEVIDKVRADADDLDDLEAEIYDNYAYYIYEDESELSITDAYVLTLSLEVSGEDGDAALYIPELLVIKENGDWALPFGLIHTDFYSNL